MAFTVGVRLAVAGAVASACVGALAGPAAAATYSIRAVGANASAFAINDRGDVTGCFFEFGDDQAYVLRGGTFVDLADPLGGFRSCGLGLNTAGDLVGSHVSGDFDTFAFLLPRAATEPLDIAGPGSRAEDVNDAGQVVGTGSHFGRTRAFLWSGGRARDLGTLGGKQSSASATAAPGQVVGSAQTPSGAFHAFLFRAGQMHDLGTLGGAFSAALDVTADDHVVGEARLGTNGMRAFLWTPASGMRSLGSLVPHRLSIANGLNSDDVVVGSGFVARGEARAFVWTAPTGMRNLNALIPPQSGWTLLEATAINSAGQIVGNGLLNGTRAAFLLTPS